MDTEKLKSCVAKVKSAGDLPYLSEPSSQPVENTELKPVVCAVDPPKQESQAPKSSGIISILHDLIKRKYRVTLMLSSENDTQVRVIVSTTETDGEKYICKTPLTAVGTPEELDKHLPHIITEYKETMVSSMDNLKQIQDNIEALKKEAQQAEDEARKKRTSEARKLKKEAVKPDGKDEKTDKPVEAAAKPAEAAQTPDLFGGK